jgi:threonine/homoserine/homoserine lactone efflux protein
MPGRRPSHSPQMPSPETLYVFAGACVALVVVPGPAVLYIVSRSVAHGRRAGLVSTAGIETGNFLQVVAASAGLAAIVASSATLFSIVKYAGAAYLIYLGLQSLLARGDAAWEDIGRGRSHRRLYWEGVAVGTLNPKLALFLLAFLPQFIDSGAGPVWLQTLVLGSLFSVVATVGDSLFALAAGSVAERWRSGDRAALWARRASGGILVGLGAVAALAEGRSTD